MFFKRGSFGSAQVEKVVIRGGQGRKLGGGGLSRGTYLYCTYMRVPPGTYSTGYNEHVHEEANIFGKLTAYQTSPICMSFVFSAVVFFIDHYCAGGI